MAKRKKLPKNILIYEMEQLDDGTPIYAVAEDVNEIMENHDGKVVGVYTLGACYKFKTRRELV